MKTLSRRSFFLSIAAIPALAPAAGAATPAAPCVDIPEGWSVASFAGKTSFPTTKRIADVYFCDPLAHEFMVAQVRMSSLPKLAGYPVMVCHPHIYRSLRIRQAFGRRDPVSFGDSPTWPQETNASADQILSWKRFSVDRPRRATIYARS